MQHDGSEASKGSGASSDRFDQPGLRLLSPLTDVTGHLRAQKTPWEEKLFFGRFTLLRSGDHSKLILNSSPQKALTIHPFSDSSATGTIQTFLGLG